MPCRPEQKSTRPVHLRAFARRHCLVCLPASNEHFASFTKITLRTSHDVRTQIHAEYSAGKLCASLISLPPWPFAADSSNTSDA